jgi:hypothetical protein
MNHTDELTGTHVLVHPGLTRDPAGRAGETGVITGLDHNGDNAYVSFGKKGQLMYGLDAILVPRTPDEIKETLSRRGSELNVADHTALFRMALLLEFGQSASNMKTALTLASESDAVRKHSMISVQEAFNLRHEYAMER